MYLLINKYLFSCCIFFIFSFFYLINLTNTFSIEIILNLFFMTAYYLLFPTIHIQSYFIKVSYGALKANF